MFFSYHLCSFRIMQDVKARFFSQHLCSFWIIGVFFLNPTKAYKSKRNLHQCSNQRILTGDIFDISLQHVSVQEKTPGKSDTISETKVWQCLIRAATPATQDLEVSFAKCWQSGYKHCGQVVIQIQTNSRFFVSNKLALQRKAFQSGRLKCCCCCCCCRWKGPRSI